MLMCSWSLLIHANSTAFNVPNLITHNLAIPAEPICKRAFMPVVSDKGPSFLLIFCLFWFSRFQTGCYMTGGRNFTAKGKLVWKRSMMHEACLQASLPCVLLLAGAVGRSYLQCQKLWQSRTLSGWNPANEVAVRMLRMLHLFLCTLVARFCAREWCCHQLGTAVFTERFHHLISVVAVKELVIDRKGDCNTQSLDFPVLINGLYLELYVHSNAFP